MEAEQAVVVATGAFFDPVILLFLSGFVMSEVMVKRGISQRAAAAVLRNAGTGPRAVLLVSMLGCCASSAVISNVPAAVLGTALLKPTFKPHNGGAEWSVCGFPCTPTPTQDLVQHNHTTFHLWKSPSAAIAATTTLASTTTLATTTTHHHFSHHFSHHPQSTFN
jgi:hypothetical protein